MSMNLKHAMYLAMENAQTIVARFPNSTKDYIYLAPKAMLVVKDDWVVVPQGKESFTCVQVIEVHEDVDIDTSQESIVYKWVVQRVNTTWYDRQIDQDNTTMRRLKRRQRQQMARQLLDDTGDVGVRCIELNTGVR